MLFSRYLNVMAFNLLIFGLGNTFDELVNSLGFPEVSFYISIQRIVCNIAFSLIYVFLVKRDIIALAFGTLTAEFITILLGYYYIRRYKIPLKFALKNIRISYFLPIVRSGIPISTEVFAGGLSRFFIYKIIAILLGVPGINCFAILLPVQQLLLTPFQAGNDIISSLGCMLYSGGDKKNLRYVIIQSMLQAGISLFFICGAFSIVLPQYIALFHEVTPDMAVQIRNGFYFSAIFLIFPAATSIIKNILIAVDDSGRALAFTWIPDIILSPPFFCLLVSYFKYIGLWLAFPLTHLGWIVVLYVCHRSSTKEETQRFTSHTLGLNAIMSQSNENEIHLINNSSKENIKDACQKIECFLKERNISPSISEKAIQSIDRIAMDMLEKQQSASKSKAMFFEADAILKDNSVRVFLRNNAAQYNPLKEQRELDIALNSLFKVDYEYLYRMNFIFFEWNY